MSILHYDEPDLIRMLMDVGAACAEPNANVLDIVHKRMEAELAKSERYHFATVQRPLRGLSLVLFSADSQALVPVDIDLNSPNVDETLQILGPRLAKELRYHYDHLPRRN